MACVGSQKVLVARRRDYSTIIACPHAALALACHAFPTPGPCRKLTANEEHPTGDRQLGSCARVVRVILRNFVERDERSRTHDRCATNGPKLELVR